MKKKNGNKIEIGNSLVFEQVGEIKKKFDKLISKEASIKIVSDGIKNIDLTGLQLIQYFMIQSKIQKKELAFSLKIDEEPRQMLLKNGYSDLLEAVFK